MYRLICCLFIFPALLVAYQGQHVTYIDYGIPPPATIPGDELGKCFGHLDFLWMPSKTSLFPFGTRYTQQEEGKVAEVGSVQAVPFPQVTSMGWRLFGGLSLPYDQWSIGVTWTFLQGDAAARRADQGFQQEGVGHFFSSGVDFVETVSDFTTPLNHKGKMDVTLQQAEGTLFRTFLVGPRVTLTPKFGFASLFIEQNYQVQSKTFEGILFSSTKIKNRLEGYGMTAGLKSFWELGLGLGLVGLCDASLYFIENQGRHTIQSENITLDLPYEWSGVQGSSQMGFGFEWRCSTPQDTHFWFIRGLFEYFLLLNETGYLRHTGFQSGVPTQSFVEGDLSFYGFSLSCGITI